MKNQKEIAQELHDELTEDLVRKYLELDFANLREPIKKQDKICTEIMHLQEKISLLERRHKLI